MVFAETHDDRAVHAGAGSGGGPVFKHVAAGAEAQHVERLALGVGARAAETGSDHIQCQALAGLTSSTT